MPLQEHIDELESLIGDPRTGLPDPVFALVSRLTPLVNVDLLIRNDRGETLLTWREDAFYRGWHVPGGIVRFKERMTDRLLAVARTELGAAVTVKGGPVAVNEVMHPTRDVRGHFISFLYECALLGPPAGDTKYDGGHPKHGEWAWHASAPADLIPQHNMYRAWIDGEAGRA